MTRLRNLALPSALLVCCILAVPASAGVYTDFSSFPNGTLAEALTVPGVTFSSVPAGAWQVQPPGGFITISGKVLIEPTTTSILTMAFSQGEYGYSFKFATNGPATLSVGGYVGGNLVFTNTFSGVVPNGGTFPEGVASGSGTPFDTLTVSTVGGQLIAIGNLGANDAPIPATTPLGLALLVASILVAGVLLLRRQG